MIYSTTYKNHSRTPRPGEQRVENLRTNGLINPIGYALGTPSLSWVIVAPPRAQLISTMVQVSRDSLFNNILYESDKSEPISSIDFRLNIQLSPRTRYYWRVIVQTSIGTSKSPVVFFETSKMDEPWTAQWITPALSDTFSNHDSPIIRKSIFLSSFPKKARIYITGLGLYQLYINGQDASNELLTPYCNDYYTWLQYQTFDITLLLHAGENVIGVMLGDGWAKGRWGFSGFPADMSRKTQFYGDQIEKVINISVLIAELHVEYMDGKTEVFSTDSTWTFAKSEVVISNIYDGEVIDGNILLQEKGWKMPGFDRPWSSMVEIPAPEGIGNLSARYSPPVIAKHYLKPKSFVQQTNETIINMGQNIVGWPLITINEEVPKDFEIILEFGEYVDDNKFFNKNLRGAQQQFRYISNGEDAGTRIRPHFTFYGFQYVKVVQWYGQPKLANFASLSIYSDLTQTGFIITSNREVNQVFSNTIWSQRDNFVDVPTDCPQRNERMGWTGDAQNFVGTAMFNMNSYAFYRKYLHDMYQYQMSENGSFVPNVIPSLQNRSEVKGGKGGWADAATIMPWKIYLFTGKKQILEEQIDSMQMWVDWITEHTNIEERLDQEDNNTYLWITDNNQFGDWLALDGPKSRIINYKAAIGGTETSFLCSAFYYYSTTLLVKAAEVLGKQEMVQKYSELASNILQSIRNEYFTPSGRCAINTQTAHVLSLQFGLVPEEQRLATFSALYELLLEDKRLDHLKLKTGFLGTPYICRALSDFGYPRLSYNIFLSPEIPGWIYEVKMGATSMWERWDSILPNLSFNQQYSMNSLNHYWSGSIFEWFYSNVAGISPIESSPGFKEFNLHPQPVFDRRLRKIEVTYQSPMGTIYSRWETTSPDTCLFTFTVPYNSIAHLKIRNGNYSTLKFNNKFNKCKDNLRQEDNDIVGDLLTGRYQFSCVISENTFIPDPLYQ